MRELEKAALHIPEMPQTFQGMNHLYAPSMAWGDLVALVHKINSWDKRITCVVHPQASGVVESERFGNIRTEHGPAGYVLQDGTRVAL